SAARILGRRRVRRLPFPSVNEGAERRQALGAERRTRGPPRGRADLRFAGDQPANDAGRRASRRSTAASFRTRAALSREGSDLSDQPTLGGGDRSVPQAEPRVARVQGYEPCPREPHPVPLSRRLMKTPSSGQDNGEYNPEEE